MSTFQLSSSTLCNHIVLLRDFFFVYAEYPLYSTYDFFLSFKLANYIFVVIIDIKKIIKSFGFWYNIKLNSFLLLALANNEFISYFLEIYIKNSYFLAYIFQTYNLKPTTKGVMPDFTIIPTLTLILAPIFNILIDKYTNKNF